MADGQSWRAELAAYRAGTGTAPPPPGPEADVEPALEPEPPAAAEPDADAGPDRPSRAGTRLAVALAVLFAAVAVFLAFVATSLRDELDEERDVRADVEDVAGRFTEAALTYDFRDVEATREAVLELSAGTFATEFDEAFVGLAELIEETQGATQATVKDVFVSRIDGDRATAITVVDTVGTGLSGPRSQPDGYLRLDLVRTEDGWKVDGVTNLSLAPTATTSTTAPAG